MDFMVYKKLYTKIKKIIWLPFYFDQSTKFNQEPMKKLFSWAPDLAHKNF